MLSPRPDDDSVYLAARAAGLFRADDMSLCVLQQMVTRANVIVDVRLGTGARLIEGNLRAILREVHHRRRSTDLPPRK